MFWTVIRHEFHYRFKLISTWIYLILLFGFAFLIANTAGGAFEGVNMQGGRSGEFSFANSPLNIASYAMVLFYFCTIIFAAIFGSSAVRDFETGSYELYFTKPVKPRSYLLGKFLGSYLSAMLLAVAILLGLALGFQMPYLQQFKIGPHLPMAYLHVFVFFAIPNTFLIGTLCFNIGILSRKVINSYIMGIGLFFSYLLAKILSEDVEMLDSAALIDPFGFSAIEVVSRYWTTAESNINFLSMSGLLGWNRLLWLGIGILITLFAVYRFDFRKDQNRQKAGKPQKRDANPAGIDLSFTATPRPYSSLQQFLHLLRYEFKCIVLNRTFLVISVFFGFFLAIVATQAVGKIYGTQTHPITNQVLDALIGNFYVFGMIIVTFYAGDLLWRDRSLKQDQLLDVTPHYSSIGYFSKLGAIVLMQLLLLSIIMLVGIVVQLVKGHYLLELGLYLSRLYVLAFLTMLPLTLMAFFWGIVMNNRYVGYLAMIAFYLISPALLMFRFYHSLYHFGVGGAYYSDMNGYGGTLPRFMIWFCYWSLFAITLSLLGFKLWNRGTDTSFKSKWKKIKSDGFDLNLKLATASLAGFLLIGSLIFYNTNVLKEYVSPRKQEQQQVEYEKNYRERLLALPQPRISEVDVRVDLYPSQRALTAEGSFWLVNRGTAPIDTLVLNFDKDYTKQKLEFSREAILAETYPPASLSIYSLPQALAPQDSMQLHFAFESKPRALPRIMASSQVRHNGSFIHSTIFPSLGYMERYELRDNNDRKKKGLPPKLRMAAISDSSQYGNPYVSTDSDYVRYHALVSTEEGQIAFAPGDLLQSKTENGRYIAQFGSSVPILNFFAFISGRYEKVSAYYQDKLVEIYYDKKHAYNVESMLQSSVASLQYFSENFMPYPHQALRIVEVPYVYFAQSFPALIPFSENVGFIAKVDPEDNSSVDYPYQIVAHEIGHQWWAHTVIGANVQGATMLSEVFTEYSSLMVLKQKYGEERLRRYLSYQHDMYLQGRSFEYREEQPLYMNENQGYLNYNKGTLVMYALQGYIGADAVNKALGAFCRKYAYHSDPFPLSTDAMPYIRAALPAHLKHLATDLFERITLYENKIISASHEQTGDKYKSSITFSSLKYHAEGLGKEESVPLDDWLDIAIYDEKEEKLLAQESFHVQGGEQTVSIISKEKPGKVVLDPHFKMIDKDRKSNSQSL